VRQRYSFDITEAKPLMRHDQALITKKNLGKELCEYSLHLFYCSTGKNNQIWTMGSK